MSKISVIIPVLNEAPCIGVLLTCLSHSQVEIIVVDGGSNDGTKEIAQNFDCELVSSKPGRAIQMNAGAKQASGDILFFLHADSVLPENFDKLILSEMDQGIAELSKKEVWGRFNIRLSGTKILLSIIAWMMNGRSSLTDMCTGDQGLFIHKDLFFALDGFAEIPIMEDIEISARLKKHSKPRVIQQKLTTSSRRWEEKGIIKTMLLMWRLRFLYHYGVSPENLVHRYQSGNK